jgi:hypothetical protein
MKPTLSILLTLLVFVVNTTTAQEKTSVAEKTTPKEFSIPASPVFDLMGVSPAQVTNLSDIKDFKVDWSFKSWKVSPNLALQAQPVWELLYNRKSLEKYRRASPLMRMLSTLDVSMGTVQNEENDRRIGFAAKITLFRKRDPMMANMYDDIEIKYKEEALKVDQDIKAMQAQLDTTVNILQKPALREQLQQLESQYFTINSRRTAEINERVKIYNTEYWNNSYLNIAFGDIYTYQTDSAGTLKKLRVNRNTASGVWLNGGFSLSKKLFLSGLLRSSFYEDQLDFLLENNDTGEQTPQQAIAKNTLFSLGANIRYGGPIYTFFLELLHERKALKTAGQALNDVFEAPAGFKIIGETVKWNAVQPYTINVGGDWRISRNVIINYGIRGLMDKKFKTTSFTPVVNIACMMR